MSERGFIAVDRGVFDHAIFTEEPKTEREAWLWIIANAVWAPQQKRVGSQVLDLQRGQLGCSLRFLARAWMWNDSRVRRFLAKLQAAQMIDAVSTQMATQITVCNYDVYQQTRRSSDAETGAVATQTNTRKQDTNSEPNGSSRSAQRGSRILDFEPEIAVAVDMGLTPEQARFQAECFKDFWRGKAGQAGVKLDWPATWRNWVRDKLPAASRSGLRLAHTNRDPPKKSGAALMEESSRELLDEMRNPDTQRWELERVYDGYAHRR